MKYLQILVSLLSCSLVFGGVNIAYIEEFLHKEYEVLTSQACYNVEKSRIDSKLDVMDNTKRDMSAQSFVDAEKIFAELNARLVRYTNQAGKIKNETLKKYVSMALDEGQIKFNENKSKERHTVYANMMKIRNTAKICPYQIQKCDLSTEGIGLYEVEGIMDTSTNYDELLYLWKAWRRECGPTWQLKEIWERYIKLAYSKEILSTKSRLRRKQEEKKDEILTYWEKIKPLYTELHTYVGNKLKLHYGDKLEITKEGLIPAHLLGNFWTQNWYPLEPLVRPFPNVSDGDLDENMKRDFTVLHLFKSADYFFQSLGLEPMEDSYAAEPGQMITKPNDGRTVDCFPMAHDLCKNAFLNSITYCARVSLPDYIKIFNLLGQIQYFIQYQDQPFLYRGSPNIKFLEAIGEVVALSANSPRYLEKLQLITEHRSSYEWQINYLMKMALIKVAYLPAKMIVDIWKWNVIYGSVPKDEWNSHWWELKKDHQKVIPPVPRSEKDFDVGSIYHIVADYGFISYFYAHMIEFQTYRHLCIEAGEYNPAISKIAPLHSCNFYKSKEVGRIISDALKVGKSNSSEEVLKMLSGSEHISVEPLLEYFQPLYEYLKKENHIPKPVYFWHLPHMVPLISVLGVLGVIALPSGFFALYLKFRLLQGLVRRNFR